MEIFLRTLLSRTLFEISYSISWNFPNYFLSLPLFSELCRCPHGWKLRDEDLYIGKAYLTLCAWHMGIWQFQTNSQEHCNKDAHGYVISDIYETNMGISRLSFIHIGVGFGVARSTVRAMPEPQSVGRVARELPRFFMYSKVFVIAKFWEFYWHK